MNKNFRIIFLSMLTLCGMCLMLTYQINRNQDHLLQVSEIVVKQQLQIDELRTKHGEKIVYIEEKK